MEDWLDKPAKCPFGYKILKLPSFREADRELVPVLVDRRTGLMPRLALRWIMRSRRLQVGEASMVHGLNAIGLVYAFCEESAKLDLDEFFGDGEFFKVSQLEQISEYLRSAYSKNGMRAGTTAGIYAVYCQNFLYWLADAEGRGGIKPVNPEKLAQYRRRLDRIFSPLAAGINNGARKPPLSEEMDERLAVLIDPIRGPDGKFAFPLRFANSNPWKPAVRLRNWIAYRIGRECGFRRGEIGSLRLDDIKRVAGNDILSVTRRPTDQSDTRSNLKRPRVKMLGRDALISPVLKQAISQYANTPLKKGGRLGARTPYLLVTNSGAAISGSSLDAIWNAPNSAMQGLMMSWHVLRHTWAEELADLLFKKNMGKPDSSEVVVGILRQLGGWSNKSETPFRYVRSTLRKLGMEYVRERNARFDQEQTGKAASGVVVA